jgi:hypothetical protein
MAIGFARQTNIGLDKENFTGAFTYNWTPKKNNSARFDLFNAQFVQNLNPQNYFNVYGSSYRALNEIGKIYNTEPSYFNDDTDLIIETGTSGFINEVLSPTSGLTLSTKIMLLKSIEERRLRLTENDFILATSYVYKNNEN